MERAYKLRAHRENLMWPERQNVSEAIAQYKAGLGKQNPEEVRRHLMGDWNVC